MQSKRQNDRIGISIGYGIMVCVTIGAILGFFNVQHQGFYMWLSASIPFGVAAGVIAGALLDARENRKAGKAGSNERNS